MQGSGFFDTECKIATEELTSAGTLFYQNSQATCVNIGDCRFCLPTIIDIDQYLLKLFQNIIGIFFLNHSIQLDFSVMFQTRRCKRCYIV